jgi:hypothetical protein
MFSCTMPSSGMWRRVNLVWTNVSEERIASIFGVEKSACKEKCKFLERGFFYPEDGGDKLLRNVGSHKNYTSQKTAFFKVTAVKTSKLTCLLVVC